MLWYRPRETTQDPICDSLNFGFAAEGSWPVSERCLTPGGTASKRMGLLATGNAGHGAIVRGDFQLQAGQVLKTGRQQRSALRGFWTALCYCYR